MQNLSKGYETTIPAFQNKDKFTRKTTVHEDGTWCVAFVKDELPSLNDMTYIQKRLYLNEQHPFESGLVIKYNGPKAIFFGTYQKEYRTAGRRIFAKRRWVEAIRYDGKRVITNRDLSLQGNHLVEAIVYLFGLEAVYKYEEKGFNQVLFRNKQVLKGIFSQRLTNLHDIIKTWLQSSCKVKLDTVNYDTIRDYLELTDANAMEIIRLSEFTTSLEKSLRQLTDLERRKRQTMRSDLDPAENERINKDIEDARARSVLFRDIMQDAETLGIRINPQWSDRRMNEEHLKNTELIMALREGELKEDPVYEMDESEINIRVTVNGIPLEGTVLNNQKSVFREGTKMHHCLFSHYWQNISKRQYIALSFVAPERVTVGITRTWNREKGMYENKAVIEQMHTVGNGSPTNEFKEAVERYFRENLSFFDGLLRQSEKGKEPDDQTLPFNGGPALLPGGGDFDEDLPY